MKNPELTLGKIAEEIRTNDKTPLGQATAELLDCVIGGYFNGCSDAAAVNKAIEAITEPWGREPTEEPTDDLYMGVSD